MASIITIGYISQELVHGQLNSNQVDTILAALIYNLQMNQEVELIKHAIIAFLNFLIFAKKNMETPHEKDVIFNTIFNALGHPVAEVREYAMQCLVELSRLYYEEIDTHIDTIANNLEHFMINDEQKVAIQAFEFWCSISDEEVNRVKMNQPILNYCERASGVLLNTTISCLLKRNPEIEKFNEDDWNCVKASSVLLENLCQCTGEHLVDRIVELIRDNINSENYKIRDSIILAFGSILEAKAVLKIKSLIVNAIPTLINMLKDDSSEVRNTVSWCIKKICELHADVFIENVALFNDFVDNLIPHLKSAKKVVVPICDSIHFLAFNLRPDTQNGVTSGLMSRHVDNLLKALLNTAYTSGAYDSDNNVALAAFYAIGSLIDYAPVDTYAYINNFFPTICSTFQQALSPEQFGGTEPMRLSYQCYLATVISACAVEDKVKLLPEQANAVYNMIKETFVQRQTVYEEGLMACSSIALSMGQNFLPLIQDFGSYLLYALSQWEDASLCRIAINCTSDLLRALEGAMSAYLVQILPIILNILDVI